jgi:pyridoxamine 5'-phosphate oxidase
MSIADLRRDYRSHVLVESEAASDPLVQFRQWFHEAVRAELLEPNAMTLATVTPSGDPAARTVLLKDLDATGFVFFTNYDSAKGRDLARHPRACLLFFWGELERQVRITGRVERLTADESLAYFRSRPRGSQLGAWASPQSRVIESRDILDRALAELDATYTGADIPLPPFWGGFRVMPEAMEFWQGRTSRLHDRLLYSRIDDQWSRVRLAP